MSIILNEYCDYTPSTDNSKRTFQFQESGCSRDYSVPENTLMVEIEGIHAYPYQTRNFTRYMPQALKKSAKKWTHPYLRPLIKHHNDKDGYIIGRIYDATYTEDTSVDGVGGLLFTVSIPDEKDAKEVEDRRLETVSIGVSANDVRCSICGEQILDPEEGCPNGHDRGQEYDDKICCWDIYDIEPKELSYVIVPSDMFAKNKRTYRTQTQKQKSGKILTEAADEKIITKDNGGKNPQMNPKEEKEKLPEQDLEGKSDTEFAQLKVEKEKLEQEKQELLRQNSELQKTLEEIRQVVETTKAELESVKADLETSKTEAEKAKEEAETANEEVEAVKAEKDASDQAGIEAREQVRKLTEASVSLYRKLLGKAELTEEEMTARSIESLNDSLKDYKEEYKSEIVGNKIANPLGNAKKGDNGNDKKNVNLKEGLSDLFNKLC